MLYGATSDRNGRTLITIDPYTAHTTRIGPFVNQVNVAVTVTDLAFESRKLLGGPGRVSSRSIPLQGE
jgi:hypothetical protein